MLDHYIIEWQDSQRQKISRKEERGRERVEDIRSAFVLRDDVFLSLCVCVSLSMAFFLNGHPSLGFKIL